MSLPVQPLFFSDLPPRLVALQHRLLQLRRMDQLLLQNGDEGHASAPSNIALLKYWGKAKGRLQQPLNTSLSYTLGGFRAFTVVTSLGRFFPCNDNEPWQERFEPHQFALFDGVSSVPSLTEPPEKMKNLLEAMLYPFACDISLGVESFNNFPTACGIASSASGYAALVAATADLLCLREHFSEEDFLYWIAEWARIGSGSATRSAVMLPAAFVQWNVPEEISQGFSTTQVLTVHSEWQKIAHCVFVLESHPKETASSRGHELVHSSPLQPIRLAGLPARVTQMQNALANFDFFSLQQIAEADAFAMHAVMQTSSPPLRYLNNNVAHCIARFVTLRDQKKLPAFWTLDAGSNVHFLFLPEARNLILDLYAELNHDGRFPVTLLANGASCGLVFGKTDNNRLKHQELLHVGGFPFQ